MSLSLNFLGVLVYAVNDKLPAVDFIPLADKGFRRFFLCEIGALDKVSNVLVIACAAPVVVFPPDRRLSIRRIRHNPRQSSTSRIWSFSSASSSMSGSCCGSVTPSSVLISPSFKRFSRSLRLKFVAGHSCVNIGNFTSRSTTWVSFKGINLVFIHTEIHRDAKLKVVPDGFVAGTAEQLRRFGSGKPLFSFSAGLIVNNEYVPF